MNKFVRTRRKCTEVWKLFFNCNNRYLKNIKNIYSGFYHKISIYYGAFKNDYFAGEKSFFDENNQLVASVSSHSKLSKSAMINASVPISFTSAVPIQVWVIRAQVKTIAGVLTSYWLLKDFRRTVNYLETLQPQKQIQM